MAKLLTLKSSKDFQRIKSAKRKWITKNVILQYVANDQGNFRIAFVVTKKLGNAVVRNKLRRRLREVARLHLQHKAPPGFDYIIIARHGMLDLSFQDLCKDLLSGLSYLHRKNKR